MEPFIEPITWVNYLPAIVYLAVVSGFVLRKRVWHPVHLIGLAVGLPARFILEGPVSLIAPAVAVTAFFVLVWALSKTISATGILALTVSLALLPINGWPGLGLGLLVALIVSISRTSLHRTRQVGAGALMSMGVTPHGIGVPNLGYLPQKSTESNGKKTLLPPYFLVGVAAGAVVEYLIR